MTEAAGATAPDDDAGDDADAPVAAPRRGGLLGALARVPFTVTVVVLMLGLGAITGALYTSIVDSGLIDTVGYGLPAFQEGRWWTVVTGSLFALTPLQYVAVAGGFALLVGASEWVLGTRRTAIATIVGQLVGVLGSAALLALLQDSSWDWAVRVADDLDVGFSAGALAAVGAASVVVRPPWRQRVRFVLVLYVVLAFLYVGLLWDLEHLLAAFLGLALGPLLVGRRPQISRPRLSRHEWRVTAATLFLVSALIRLLLLLFPADGPLGDAPEDQVAWSVLLGVVLSLAIAYGLRKGRRTAWRWAIALTLAAVVVVALLVLLLVAEPEALPETGSVASGIVDLLLWLTQLAVLVLGRDAFRAPSSRARGADPAGNGTRETAIALLTEHGGTDLSWMGTWDDNAWFVVEDAHRRPAGYQSFQAHRGVAVGLGDPVGPDAQRRQRILDAYVDKQAELGRSWCLFSVTDEVAAWSDARGFRRVPVAEEAVIDLPDLEFRGKKWQDVRSALNRAGKEGITYQEGRLADMQSSVLRQVRAISEMWVSDKGLPEMRFTLGTVDEALDPFVRVGLAVDADGMVHGVTSWLPVIGPGGAVRGWTLDVMRRLPDGFRPVTEFLVASACLSFRDQGAVLVSLSGAPLAHSGDMEGDALVRLLDSLGETLEPLYGFRSLDSFKQKFQPRHETLHLVYPDEAALPRIGVALTEAYLPGSPLLRTAVTGLSALREAKAGEPDR